MTEHDQLPLPDYDHLPVEGLPSRIRMLEARDLETVLDYERAHADRPRVVQIMENRLAELREGANPPAGTPPARAPATPGLPPAGSPGPGRPTGPPTTPPSHGDPTTPAQPRPKGGSGPG